MTSILSPQGPAARALADIGWPVLLLFLAVTGVMWGLLVWLVVRRRGSYADQVATSADGTGTRWILIGGFATPAIVLALIFVATLGALKAFPVHEPDHREPQIRVIGHRWWWEIEYLYGGVHERVKSATELHIPAGEPVDIELVTRDVIHSFWVPDLHGKVDLLPHMRTRIRIQADRPGIYRGKCAEFCGTQHTNMTFHVIAQEKPVFDAWLTRERQPAAEPVSDAARQGATVFATRACALCHTVRGSGANGLVGPDLTHFGSRRWIAGPMPNNEAYLRAWVTHAQSLKPGVVMPSILDFTGEELHALTAYLRELK